VHNVFGDEGSKQELGLLIKGVGKCLPAADGKTASTALCYAVDARDQMFTHSLSAHRDIGAALSQYFNVGLQQFRCFEHIVATALSNDRTICVLDFACGFGRSLRFMVAMLPEARIVASELQPEALEFVASTFDVPTVASHADPAMFSVDERFDLVWVASLFTHLPEPLFSGWLHKLYSLLSPRGVLCFSARDASLLSAAEKMPESGFLYQQISENSGLSAQIYGTTYVTEQYVSAALRAAIGPEACFCRLPRALAMEQDLYCVSQGQRNLDAVLKFERGCWGWVDIRTLSVSGRLHVEGWAGSMLHSPAERIEITIDGQTYQTSPCVNRPDVVEVFEKNELLACGWRFQQQLDPATKQVELLVTAHAGRNSTLLYAGVVKADA